MALAFSWTLFAAGAARAQTPSAQPDLTKITSEAQTWLADMVRINTVNPPGNDGSPDASQDAPLSAILRDAAASDARVSHVALDLDHLVQMRKWKTASAAQTIFAVGGTDQENAGNRCRGAQTMNDFDQPGAIFFRRPRPAQGFVSSVCENNESGIAAH